MSFNDLDPTVLMLIASQLQQLESKIAPYATISRPWLSVVEALTFRKLHVNSEERLGQLVRYLTPDRRAAFRSLEVTIYLPEYEEEKWACLETVQEKAANDQAFTKSLTTIFETLNSWNKPVATGFSSCTSVLNSSNSLQTIETEQAGFALEVQAICRSDYWEVDYSVQRNRSLHVEYDVYMLRQEKSRLQLVGELPPLFGVSELIVHGGAPRSINACYPRQIAGDTVAHIAEACPRLKIVEIELSDRESNFLTRRNIERSVFAQSLRRMPSTTSQLKLHYPGVVPANHFFDPPVIPSADGQDLLSLSLGTLSRQLETLHLCAVLGVDFFDITDPSKHWPRLRKLYIEFDFCTPNGVWMLEQDPEESEEEIDPDEEMDYSDMGRYDDRSHYQIPARFDFPDKPFRTAVNADVFDGVSLAMSQALPSMPNLREARLSVGESGAGCVCTYTSDGQKSHKVMWRTRSTTTYEPHPEVLEGWERAFSQRSGQLEMQVVGIEHTEAPDLVGEITWPSF